MHIHLDTAGLHTIQSYSHDRIQINSIIYTGSLIVSKEKIISDLIIKNIQEIDSYYLDLFTAFKPEVIIIGYEQPGKYLPMHVISQLSQQSIGIECMSIGAACRTFNILLGEHRAVVAGFILNT